MCGFWSDAEDWAQMRHSDWQAHLAVTKAARTLRKADVTSGENMLREEFAHVLGDQSWTDVNTDPAMVAERPYAYTLPELIRKLHSKEDEHRPKALCLSGGGIRSATFGLGVLQWLAGHKQLERFHYLSTVSGGGYIGSFLVNALQQTRDHARRAILAARHNELMTLETCRSDPQADQASKDAAEAEILKLREAADEAGQAGVHDWVSRLGNSAGTEDAARSSGATLLAAGAKDPVAMLRAYSNYLSRRRWVGVVATRASFNLIQAVVSEACLVCVDESTVTATGCNCPGFIQRLGGRDS